MSQTQSPRHLTFATLLGTLYALAKSHCRNQVVFFCSLFCSYCRYRSYNTMSIWQPTQSNVSDLLQGRRKPSYRQYDYYLNMDPHALRNDATSFARRVAPTPALDSYYYMMLADLLDTADNIPLFEQEAIQKLVFAGDDDFSEILYQLLYYLFCLPSSIAIGEE